MKKYTTKEVSEITGLSIICLTHLTRKKNERGRVILFEPTWRGEGSGYKTYWSEKDIEKLKEYKKARDEYKAAFEVFND